MQYICNWMLHTETLSHWFLLTFFHEIVHYSITYFEGSGEELNGKLLILSQNISVCVHMYCIMDIQSGKYLMIMFIVN